MKESGLSLDVRKKFLTVKYWNRMHREVVDVTSLVVFKSKLDGALSSLSELMLSLPTDTGHYMIFKVFFLCKPFYVLLFCDTNIQKLREL